MKNLMFEILKMKSFVFNIDEDEEGVVYTSESEAGVAQITLRNKVVEFTDDAKSVCADDWNGKSMLIIGDDTQKIEALSAFIKQRLPLYKNLDLTIAKY